MRRVDKLLIIVYFIGILVAGSDSEVVWPWNVLAGACILVLVFIGVSIAKIGPEDNRHPGD